MNCKHYNCEFAGVKAGIVGNDFYWWRCKACGAIALAKQERRQDWQLKESSTTRNMSDVKPQAAQALT